MPIKGLTNRDEAFPEIGRIRKGGKKKPSMPGPDLKYFRADFGELKDEDGNLIENAAEKKFLAAYGKKPTAIRVILPFNEIKRSWSAFKEANTAGRMVAKSDGEFILYQQDDSGNVIVRNGERLTDGSKVPHPQNNVAGRDNNGKDVKFVNVGRLCVIIPELERAAYMTFITHSKHDIANIDAQLRAFHTLNNGALAGIPFIVRRSPKKISKPINGKRVRSISWLISIEADPEWVSKKLSVLKLSALPQTEVLKIEDGLALELGDVIGSIDECVEDESGDIYTAVDVEAVIVDDDQAEKSEDAPMGDDITSSEYWKVVYEELKKTPAQGTAALHGSGGRFDVALASLRKGA